MPAFKIRSSKFRHVFGSPFRKEQSYENVRITRNAHDSSFCAVNPKNLAVVTESAGGGAFIVLPVERTGRVDLTGPKVSGHSGAVLDIKWNPFNDDLIASASEDSTVKLWQIPRDGMVMPLTDWTVDLHGHSRRVGYLEWHPTADNILLSAGFDYKCIVWNAEQAEPVNIVDCHRDTIFSIAWNREGSLFATTCKDKKLRTIDPRSGTVAVETPCHKGPKASKAVFVDNTRIATTGFSQMSERQLSLWDLRQSKTPIHSLDLDTSCGVILPYFDYDTRVIFLAGKGDGNIRYYEVSDSDSRLYFLNSYQSPSPQRGLGMMPKRGCDVRRCEIARFYKLHAAKNLVEPVSMIVPRKSDTFQEDVFPPTASTIPSLRADEWVSGQNREPILVSMQDGHITNQPKTTASKAVQKQDGALQHAPTITTYKAVDRGGGGEPPVQLRRSMTHNASSSAGSASSSSGGVVQRRFNENQAEREPASLKNIKRLSLNEEVVTVPGFLETSNKSVEKKVYSPVTPPGNHPSTNGMAASTSDSEHGNSFSAKLATQRHTTTNNSSLKAMWGPDLPPAKVRNETDTTLIGTTLMGTTLSDTTSTGMTLTGTPFTGATSTGTASTGANLMGTTLTDTGSGSRSPSLWSSPRRQPPLARAKTISSPYEHSSQIKLVIGEPSVQSHTNKIHIRKTWHSPQPVLQPVLESAPPSTTSAVHSPPLADPELKKAYFRQLEEIRSLQEQVTLKDKRIRQLETELTSLKDKEATVGPGESNC